MLRTAEATGACTAPAPAALPLEALDVDINENKTQIVFKRARKRLDHLGRYINTIIVFILKV